MKKSLLLSIALVVTGLSSFAQWEPLYSGTSSYLCSVCFTDINTGYVSGDGGVILKTTDGGQTWDLKPTGVTAFLIGLTFTTPDTGYVVGTDGIILKTTNAGETWVLKPSGVVGFLQGIYFIDSNTGIVTGQDGVILKTTDAGETWTQKQSPTSLPLRSVCFTSADTGIAVGGLYYYQGGVIIKTFDGGENWITESDGIFNLLLSVQFTNANTAFAAGGDVNSATIIKTTDAGMTWDTIPGVAAIPYTLKRVYFPVANTGYAVGEGGTILKTNDAGTTWTPQQSGTTEKLFGLFFNNVDTGYTVGDIGTILKTTNGGWYVGMNENQRSDNIIITPNPARGKISIEVSGSGNSLNGIVSVFGTTGQELFRHQVTGPRVELDVSSLQQGIYFIRLMSGGKTWTGKFMKE